jgi:hypothetical protein
VGSVPLRDETAFFEWCARGTGVDPALAKWVHAWCQAAGDAPWLAPSEPLPELSDPPLSELRYAIVPDTSVEVFYKRYFIVENVDLFWVGWVNG